MVLTAVHVVVVTLEALLEAGVQEELREEVSGEVEEAAGNSKKLTSEKDPTGPSFFGSIPFKSVSDVIQVNLKVNLNKNFVLDRS